MWYDCRPFTFLLKCDDDSFVRTDRMIPELEAISTRPDADRLHWGYFDGRAQVRRLGKYAEANWIMCDKYLPYALGGGYVLSRGLVEHTVRSQANLAMFDAEDVSLGLWLAPLKVQRKHDTR